MSTRDHIPLTPTSPRGAAMTTPHADPRRIHLPETGIYVRALHTGGTWDVVDIAHLHRDSLDAWLRSRDIDWPISVVKTLLGHDHKEN